MDYFVLWALIATLGTWFVTALGAATVVFFRSPNQKAMNLMLGFASGVMIAASFWSLLQPAIERAEAVSQVPAWFVATAGFLFGAFFMWLSDKAVTFARRRASNTSEVSSERVNRIIMLVLSITLHNIPEGLAVGVAFGALQNGGYSPENLMGAITIAIGIGEFPGRSGGICSTAPRRVFPAEKLSAGAGFRIGGADCRRCRGVAGGICGSNSALRPGLCRWRDDSGSRA